MSNNEQRGGASPHNADIAKAIVRSAGDASAQAFETRTSSPKLPGKDSPNWPYKDVGEGFGGNVKR